MWDEDFEHFPFTVFVFSLHLYCIFKMIKFYPSLCFSICYMLYKNIFFSNIINMQDNILCS